MRRTTFAVLLALAASSAPAQLHPNNARGFDSEKAYQTGDIDSINLFNGNLIVAIPIGQTFPVSDHLQYGLKLLYNGNPWDYRTDGFGPEAIPSRFHNAGIGWQLTMGDLVSPNDSLAKKFNKDGNWIYAAPDGAEHVFYRTLHEEEDGTSYEASLTPGDNGVAGYTRDASYLRLIRMGVTFLRFVREGPPSNPTFTYFYIARYKIEFPDGTQHTFTSEEYVTDTPEPPDSVYERSAGYSLTKIEDRFGNSITIADQAITGGTKRTISDSAGRTQTITSTTQSFFQFHTEEPNRALITSIKLTAPHSKTVEYAFSYGDYQTISKPCADEFATELPTTSGRFLTGITVRDADDPGTALLTYSMDNFKLETVNGISQCSWRAGHLTTLTLPTGGKIEYGAGQRTLPAIVEGKPNEGGGSPLTVSIAVGSRTLVETDGTRSTWTYQSFLRNPATYQTEEGFKTIHRELVVLVTDPLSRTTASYFNAFLLVGAVPTCFPSADTREYGLPFTRAANTGASDLFLSTETFPTACTSFVAESSNGCESNVCKNGSSTVAPVRRSYIAYDYDTLSGNEVRATDHNQRVRASRTTFLDDTACRDAQNQPVACYVETRSSNFDGLGHYRTDTRKSNIPKSSGSSVVTPDKTFVTRYNANPSRGDYAKDVNATPANYMVGTTQPWILGVFDQRSVSDGTATAYEEFCFSSLGFLESKRSRKAASNGSHDLLAVFTDADAAGVTDGNVTAESYYGGDEESLGTAACSVPSAGPKYKVLSGHSGGVRATSQYAGVTFKSVDLTIDARSGLPSASRDVAELETTMTYDVLGRLTEVHPPGSEPWTKYSYNLASTPISLGVKRYPTSDTSGNGTPLTEQVFYYDGMGRPIQQKTRMPDSGAIEQWASVRTTYDLLGRREKIGVAVFQTSSVYSATLPSNFTQLAYDRFDRVTTTTMPDTNVVTTSYTGSREVARTSSIATASGAVNATATESYDGHGRLVGLTEASGSEGADVTTTYDYDHADRLTRVTTDDETQQRTFSYDNRGFLISETHPESGTATYSYDARGHVSTKTITGETSSERNLKFLYDSAERLLQIQTHHPTDSSYRSGKVFAFAAENDGANKTKGKLASATRYNYNAGTLVVEETYDYSDAAGRLMKTTTEITKDGVTLQKLEQSQTYENGGNVDTITYPTCLTISCGSAMWNTVTSAYTKGVLTGVTGFAESIRYAAAGTVSSVDHAGPVTDTYTPDVTGARPETIQFAGYSSCSTPAIVAGSPADQTIEPNHAATLAVSATGATGYQWYEGNGTIVVGATSASFTTPILTNTKTYYAVVSNACGTATSRTATVTVCAPLSITTGSPQNQSVAPEQTATLTVSASGATSYQWYDESGLPIPGETSSTFTTPVLTNTTTYFVKASNDCATVTSRVATVTVRTLLPPTGLQASANDTSSVTISWNASADADHYVVDRKSEGSAFAPIQSVFGTWMTNTGLTADRTYVYRVRAVSTSEFVSSAPSNADLATTIIFTPLIPEETVVAAAHFEELLRAVNAVRGAKGTPATTWSGMGVSAPAADGLIEAQQLLALRAAMNAARLDLGFANVSYTDPDLTDVPIKVVHQTEIRGGAQ